MHGRKKFPSKYVFTNVKKRSGGSPSKTNPAHRMLIAPTSADFSGPRWPQDTVLRDAATCVRRICRPMFSADLYGRRWRTIHNRGDGRWRVTRPVRRSAVARTGLAVRDRRRVSRRRPSRNAMREYAGLSAGADVRTGSDTAPIDVAVDAACAEERCRRKNRGNSEHVHANTFQLLRAAETVDWKRCGRTASACPAVKGVLLFTKTYPSGTSFRARMLLRNPRSRRSGWSFSRTSRT